MKWWLQQVREVAEPLLAVLLVTTFIGTGTWVLGKSMQPNFNGGEWVLVPKYETWMHRLGIGGFARGDVLVVKPPKEVPEAQMPMLGITLYPHFIKRLIALPGDTVSVQAGVVYLNAQALAETHITDRLQPFPDSFPTLEVYQGQVVAFAGYPISELPVYLQPALSMLEPLPPQTLAASQQQPVQAVGTLRLAKGYYFVMGDNRSWGGSVDSRVFGPLPLSRIAGRAAVTLLPLAKLVPPAGFAPAQ